ncbi:MAG: hypothetical protein WA428_08400, partial [Candidatus Cybelea sp.]
CPDFETTGRKCKHLYAVEYAIRHSVKPNDETTVEQTKRVTYRQNWAAYNAAQTVEKERVANLLHALCSAIDNPAHKNGRPRLPLSPAATSNCTRRGHFKMYQPERCKVRRCLV